MIPSKAGKGLVWRAFGYLYIAILMMGLGVVFDMATLRVTAGSGTEGAATQGFEALLKKSTGGALTQVFEANGVGILKNDIHKLVGTVSPEGLTVKNTLGGQDAFSLLPVGLGHGNQMRSIGAGKVTVNASRVDLVRDVMIERFTNTSAGIRQDFIIAKRPTSDEKPSSVLTLTLRVKGAKVSTPGDQAQRATLNLSSGRSITYGKLRVFDAHNTALNAWMISSTGHDLSILVDDSNAIYPLTIDPTLVSSGWELASRLPTAIDHYAVINHAGMFYFGSEYGVFKWDGSTFTHLSGITEEVFVLYHDGTFLYAGGNFQNAGGDPDADYIAKLDGSEWASLNGSGTGLSGRVRSLTSLGGDLVAGGDFRTAGGDVNADYIAKFDGTSWISLNGVGTGLSSRVFTMQVNGGILYAGGDFSDAGGDVNADRVAKYSGGTWSSLNGVNTGVNARVYALLYNAGILYIGGQFNTAGGDADADYIAKFDGTSLQSLSGAGTGLSSHVYSLCHDGTDLYAGGSFSTAGGDVNAHRIARFDGSTWQAVGGTAFTTSGVVNAVLPHGGNIYAAGTFTDAGGDLRADSLAQYAGGAWSSLAGEGGDLWAQGIRVFATDGQYLYAGGSFTNAGGDPDADYIAKYDGTTWTSLHGPGTGLNNDVSALFHDGTALYIGGDFVDAGGDPHGDYIAKFDGTLLSAVGGAGSGLSASVSTLLAKDGILYAGGIFMDAGGDIDADYVAKFAGGSWSSLDGVGTGLSGSVSQLCYFGDHLYAVWNQRGGTGFSRFDGSSWFAVPGVLGGKGGPRMESLVSTSKFIFVGGSLGSLTPEGANIAKFDGNTWSAVGDLGAVFKRISSLHHDGTYLYASATFNNAGGDEHANGIAKYDGAVWSSLNGNGTGFGYRATGQIATYKGFVFGGGGRIISDSSEQRFLPGIAKLKLSHIPEIQNGASVTTIISKNEIPTAFSLTLSGTDIEDSGSALVWSIEAGDGPKQGTASAAGTGDSMVVSYDPTPGYVGADSFTVTLRDSSGEPDTIAVNVTVQDTTALEPTANAGPDQEVREAKTVSLDGSGSVDDVSIETILWEVISGGPVVLSDKASLTPTFLAPAVPSAGREIVLRLTVTDALGFSDQDDVTITIKDNGLPAFSDKSVTMEVEDGVGVGIETIDGSSSMVSLETVDFSSIQVFEFRPGSMPYGLFDFKLMVTPGSTAQIMVYLPEAAPQLASWTKFQNGAWVDFTEHIEFNDDRKRVTITITDGGLGDDDGLVNGVIVDPSGLSLPDTSTTSSTSTGGSGGTDSSSILDDVPALTGGGGGGGCVINRLRQ